MRVLKAFVVLFMLSAIPAFAQTPVATASDSVRFDAQDSDVTATQVNRFELCFDAQVGAACTNATPAAAKFTPTAAQGGAPAAGFSAYKQVLPALTAGNHTVHIKACNPTVCSAELLLTFQFVITPAAPVNGQFIKGLDAAEN